MSLRAKSLVNINKKIDELYKTEDYYISIAPEDFLSNGSEEYWGKIVDPDGKERNRLEEEGMYLEDIDYILKYIAQKDGGNILDIGCGLGWLLSAVDNTWDKYGLEPEEEAVRRASKFANVQNCMVESYEYQEDFFDMIVMHHTIEHMNAPESVIKNVYKMLKKGGVLIMATPDFDSACARRYGEKYRLLADPTHISLFSNDSMHRFLRDNGFKIESTEYPYFETRFFNEENILKVLDKTTVSPAFYGSFMTFFCRK